MYVRAVIVDEEATIGGRHGERVSRAEGDAAETCAESGRNQRAEGVPDGGALQEIVRGGPARSAATVAPKRGIRSELGIYAEELEEIDRKSVV